MLPVLFRQERLPAMNENSTTKCTVNFNVSPSPAKLPILEKKRIDDLTDKEIQQYANCDPNNPILTSLELEEFRHIADAKKTRCSLQLTQAVFAKTFNKFFNSHWLVPSRSILGM